MTAGWDPEAAVECRGLSKRYGSVQALAGLSLTVSRGAVFGLLGPNGAGKTSLIRLLLGFIRPGAGSLALLGQPDVERVRPRIGYLPERPHYEPLFTAREYLHSLGALLGLRPPALSERVEHLLSLAGLTDAADRRLRGYSKGMLQRAGMAQALLADPELLLLDEPSSGLDPRGQWEMGRLIGRAREERHTILLCSHSLAEVQAICTHACILRSGRAAWVGEVTPSSEPRVRIELEAVDGALRDALARVVGFELQGSGLLVLEAGQEQALRLLLDHGARIVSLNRERRSLEEVYLRATGSRQVRRAG